MTQAFSVTWIDIILVLLPLAAIGLRQSLRAYDVTVHKAFDMLLHPVSIMIVFVVLAINLSHL